MTHAEWTRKNDIISVYDALPNDTKQNDTQKKDTVEWCIAK